MTWATRRHPGLESSLRDLVEQHRDLPDEPLHLALLYDPRRDADDVFLFELLSRFGMDEVGPDREIFEVAYSSTDRLPLARGQALRLVLTNPRELSSALAEGWESAIELRDAIRRGDFEVLYEDEIGRAALKSFDD